jgi:hypothetical protein
MAGEQTIGDDLEGSSQGSVWVLPDIFPERLWETTLNLRTGYVEAETGDLHLEKSRKKR